MISKETNKQHEKHAKLARPEYGNFGRNEIAILGTSCRDIKKLASSIIRNVRSSAIAYVDADHKNAEEVASDSDTALQNGASLEYTDKISFQRLDFEKGLTPFQKRTLFNDQDLIIVNGNHFIGKSQVVVIDPVKNLEKKKEKLTDVRLILLKDPSQLIPEFLQQMLGFDLIPVLSLEDETGILNFIRGFLSKRVPPLAGLVLSGGLSSRMKKDKGNINYHGTTQRQHLYGLLSKYCYQTFISCNAEQTIEVASKFPVIQDSFLKLGPTGGILSALQTDPNAAWLTVACDLPYLSEKTIQYLVEHRSSSKMATAFWDEKGEFPEPLITIWEPRSYATLLQFLCQGYSCPRKTLINSDIELLKAPDQKELMNVNLPEQYEQTLQEMKHAKTT